MQLRCSLRRFDSQPPRPGLVSDLSTAWAVLDLFLASGRGLGLSDLEYNQVGPMKIARSHRRQTVSMVA